MATIKELLTEVEKPVLGMDDVGCINYINEAFEKTYGWAANDIVGRPVSRIIPKEMREAHAVGFSRFLSTGSSSILGKSLPLPIECKDGKVLQAAHFIVGEKNNGRWIFAARITPQHK